MNNLKKFGISLLGLALSAGVATAGPADDAKKVKELEKAVVDQGIYVETAKKGIKLSGYVDANYTYNFNGGGTDKGVNGSPGPIQGHAWGTDSQDFSVAQVKVALEKGLGDQNTWSAGFRIDLMFGEDSKYLGDNDSGMENIEQAYVQFRVPVGNGLDFKFGKFCTMLGYEVIETPANLNVTRSFVFSFGLPLTHVGIVASYKFNDNWDAQFAIVNGMNNSDSNFIGSRYDRHYYGQGEYNDYNRGSSDWGKAFSARVGFNYGQVSGALSGVYAPDGDAAIGGGAENAPVLVLNFWLQWKPTEQLLLALDTVWGKAWDTEQYYNYTQYYFDADGDKHSTSYTGNPGSVYGYDGKDPQNSDQWWGVAVYAKYQFNKVFSLATRAEYFHTEDGNALGLYDSDPIKDNYDSNYDNIPQDWGNAHTHTDIYSFTLTAGFDVWENLLMRLEYRLDAVSAAGPDYKYYSDGSLNTEENYFTNNHTYQSTVVFDVSYSF